MHPQPLRVHVTQSPCTESRRHPTPRERQCVSFFGFGSDQVLREGAAHRSLAMGHVVVVCTTSVKSSLWVSALSLPSCPDQRGRSSCQGGMQDAVTSRFALSASVFLKTKHVLNNVKLDVSPSKDGRRRKEQARSLDWVLATTSTHLQEEVHGWFD